jgi:xanthine dehydrogenase YagS FAD-binding subunit
MIMLAFGFSRAADLPAAIAAAADPETALVAGGTELVNWLKEGIVAPARLVDINGLGELVPIHVGDTSVRIGALARMNEVADHDFIRREMPAISEALLASASPQLRNMASMGGNLAQRTRCPYFRAETELPCNKRRPGTGCAALEGEDRGMAIFGWSERCIATHPSDVAVALAALDAIVHLQSGDGERTVPLVDFHRLPGDNPERDTVLRRGELITGIEVPVSPLAKRSRYLKLRERASYEFALVSVAVGLELDANEVDRIREVRIALGGVAPKPWRLARAEATLRGAPLEASAVRAALDADFAEAKPRRHNSFKIELAKRAVIRALQMAGGKA